ncbi:Putative HTH-type transcriptional regulator [Gemmata sp. SH-PL17]|nr:Putative HTH-type transcriptional regulator [Gemmata sp. SH-PL17]
MRSLLRDFAIFDAMPNDPFNPEQRRKLEERYTQSQPESSSTPPNSILLDYTDFFESYELMIKYRSLLPQGAGEELQVARQPMEHLVGIRNRVMHSRPLEPDDFATVYDASVTLLNHKNLKWSSLKATRSRLTEEPSFVLSLRIPEYPWLQPNGIPHNLPLPEFDDTGYIGRLKDRDDITKLILGHHRIVTILGEGGVGKTATLVKCLYDLIDSINKQFDMIIWVSLKNQVLTASGAQDIANSITSVTGLYKAIAKPLGVPDRELSTNILSDLHEYLSEFKILLAIDNLETIQTNELQEFIRDLPPHTKLVITSRIGLGELEIRRPLQPLNEAEAAQLLRRYSQVHAVDSLAKLPQTDIIHFCKRLHFNPLAIRWFVTSVQRGTAIQSLLSHQSDLLSFCVQNVYEKLSDESHYILEIMIAARRPLGEAELAYLANRSAISVRQQIFEISGTMILKQIHKKLLDSTIETQYALTEFSRQYFETHRRPSSQTVQMVSSRLSELASAVESAGRFTDSDPYNPRAIRIRSNNDRVAARLLQIALVESQRKSPERAMGLITQAKNVAPTYPEVYKISAFIKANTNDYHGAQEDYEQAIELSPDAPQLYFLYAGFCAYKLNDSTQALALIDRANQLDPNNLNVLADRARYLAFTGRIDEAWAIFEKLLNDVSKHNVRFQIKTYDKSLNCLHRMMERARESRDIQRATSLAATIFRIIDAASSAFPSETSFAHSFCDTLQDIAFAAARSKNKDLITQVAIRFIELNNILTHDKSFHPSLVSIANTANALNIDPESRDSLAKLAEDHGINLSKGHIIGTVTRIHADGRSGLILSDHDKVDYFFHFERLMPHVRWKDVCLGARVSFVAGANRQGPLASYVEVVD